MRTIKTVIIAAGIFAFAGIAAPAAADTPPPAQAVQPAAASAQLSYAFVDMSRILNETAVAKSVTDELGAKKKQIKSEIEQKERGLRGEADALYKQRGTLSKPEFEKKATALQAKIDSLGKSFKTRERNFEEAGKASLDKVRDIAAEYIEQVAQERRYAAVFARQAVILGSKDLDITDEVINRMNSSGKKVAVDWKAAAPEAPKAK
jgi:Skp family chaperone for outer membrane proteins